MFVCLFVFITSLPEQAGDNDVSSALVNFFLPPTDENIELTERPNPPYTFQIKSVPSMTGKDRSR